MSNKSNKLTFGSRCSTYNNINTIVQMETNVVWAVESEAWSDFRRKKTGILLLVEVKIYLLLQINGISFWYAIIFINENLI